ncbi:acyl dehydratase [Mesorhizobium sp. J18]|uniref:MaoC family dehydratase n=1 Tax=Mesorhizobium sp. J18 TaxID=935263 RepID=UPI00119B62E5|nr:MaoC/PaaZ C-terminal domain-containing protein [Mesorhizobium sp. J18]TWG94805.1 acyl dehydratase [Mesorhizobium sp. J18]
MTYMNVELSEQVRFSKTVSETDVYLFAGITGDFSGNHVDEEFMRTSRYGRRIAHGALIIGFMSTTSTMLIERALARGIDSTPVSLGYDRIRILAPVFLGDTVTVTYTIAEIDEERLRTRAKIEVTNQHGELVTVGEHILKWVPRVEPAASTGPVV